jgi:hypothetical protein
VVTVKEMDGNRIKEYIVREKEVRPSEEPATP